MQKPRRQVYNPSVILLFLLILTILGSQTAAQNITFKKRIDNGLNNYGLGVLETSAGYIMYGRGWSATQQQNGVSVKLFKTDLQGNITAFKEYGSQDANWFPGFGNSAVPTHDGNYALAGVRSYSNGQQGLLVKFNSNLDTIWTKSFLSTDGMATYQCRQTADKGFVLVGAGTDINPDNNILLIKTDSLGNELWRQEYGGAYRNIGWTVELTADGGFIIGGDSYQDGTLESRSGIIIKVDSAGNVEWDKLIGSGLDDGPFFVNTLSGGDYVVWGNWDTLSRLTQVAYISKIAIDGSILWRHLFIEQERAYINICRELSNGNILGAGQARLDTLAGRFAWLTLHDDLGNRLWERFYYWNTDSLLDMRITDFIETSDGGILVTGAAQRLESDGAIREQFLLMKLDSNGCLVNDCGLFTGIEEYVPQQTLQAKLYPNPTTGTLTIELPGGQGGSMALYNLLGQSMYQTTLAGGQTTLALNLPPGLYLYRIGSGNQATNGKLLVE